MRHTITKIKQSRTLCGPNEVKVTDERKTYLKEQNFHILTGSTICFLPVFTVTCTL